MLDGKDSWGPEAEPVAKDPDIVWPTKDESDDEFEVLFCWVRRTAEVYGGDGCSRGWCVSVRETLVAIAVGCDG